MKNCACVHGIFVTIASAVLKKICVAVHDGSYYGITFVQKERLRSTVVESQAHEENAYDFRSSMSS